MYKRQPLPRPEHVPGAPDRAGPTSARRATGLLESGPMGVRLSGGQLSAQQVRSADRIEGALRGVAVGGHATTRAPPLPAALNQPLRRAPSPRAACEGGLGAVGAAGDNGGVGVSCG